MDFNATLENSRILKGIIEAISFLIDETYVYVYPTGLKLNAIDSSHVAMLLAFLPKELFTDYKCSQDAKIGINVQDFIKILRRAKANDEIQLQLDKKDKNRGYIAVARKLAEVGLSCVKHKRPYSLTPPPRPGEATVHRAPFSVSAPRRAMARSSRRSSAGGAYSQPSAIRSA